MSDQTPGDEDKPNEPLPDDAIEARPVAPAGDFHTVRPVVRSPGPDDPAPSDAAGRDEALTDEESGADDIQEPEIELEAAAQAEAEPQPETPEPPLVMAPAQARPSNRRDSRSRRPGLIGKVVRGLILAGLLIGLILPVASTLIYRFVGPPITILMVQRMFEGRGLDRHWVPLKKMSPALPYAVIAAEDARFCSHHGFDFEAMEKAMAHNQKRPGKIRGGSTISQQTAKNVFLWPQRSYVRKGFEAWFTVLIETLWGKQRIMEVYLNSVEWGPGVYGADAAARHYFGVGADQLSANQAARLAAILPSPLKWQAARPGPYVRKRSRRIGAASGTVRRDGLAACIR